jgi:hypothetical protein
MCRERINVGNRVSALAAFRLYTCFSTHVMLGPLRCRREFPGAPLLM